MFAHSNDLAPKIAYRLLDGAAATAHTEHTCVPAFFQTGVRSHRLHFGIKDAHYAAVPACPDLFADVLGRRFVVSAFDFDIAVAVDTASRPSSKLGNRLCGKAFRALFSDVSKCAQTCRLVVPWMRLSAMLAVHHCRCSLTCARLLKSLPFRALFLTYLTPDSTLHLSVAPVRPGRQDHRAIVLGKAA